VIRGRVIAAGTPDPIRKARVTLSPGANRDPVFTDTDGRFEFVGLSAGRYEVSAAKAGYATTRFGARRAFEPPVSVDVPGGTVVSGIDLVMPKGAAISGRVLDDLLDPMIGLTVMASRVLRTGGRVQLAPVRSTQTDDLGEYRLGGLSEGSYIVSATQVAVSGGEELPRPEASASMGATPPGAGMSARTYYPGVVILAEAQPIIVRPGDEMTGIDLSMMPPTAPRLSIAVTDQSGAPAGGKFSVVPVPSFIAIGRTGGVTAGSGTTGIDPGEWMVYASDGTGVAFSPLTVGSEDVDVRLVLTRGGTVAGRVAFEGGTPPPGGRIEIEAIGAGFGGTFVIPPARAPVAPDGTFQVKNLIGIREFRLRSAPQGWRLKSLTVNGRSLLDEPVEFKGNEALTGVRAVLTMRHPVLRGVIVDHESNRVTSGSVVIFPEDRSKWRSPARWSRWVKPNHAGTFLIDDLPAGDYLAIASADVDDAVWSNEEYLDRLREGATRVALQDDDTTTVTLQMRDSR
jgi:hypothetical protein